MWVRPLSTLEEIWNSSTWLICAGSRVRISPTPAQPAVRVPPDGGAGRADGAGHQVEGGEAAGRRQEAQHRAPLELRSGEALAVETEQRVLGIEVDRIVEVRLHALADGLVEVIA